MLEHLCNSINRKSNAKQKIFFQNPVEQQNFKIIPILEVFVKKNDFFRLCYDTSEYSELLKLCRDFP